VSITGLLFAVAFLAAMVATVVRNPLYGLFTYVAIFYLHPPSRWWGESLPDLRWSFLAAGVTLIGTLIHAKPDPNRRVWLATAPAAIMAIFAGWFWFGYLWALEPAEHIGAAILLTKYLLVFYMVYRLIDTPEKGIWFLIAHLAGCFYLGTLAWGMPRTGRLDGVGGPGIDDSNTLGMHLATGVVSGAMLVLYLKGWKRYACIIAILFVLNAIVLTGSRGAFLALVAGGAVLAWLRPSSLRKQFLVYGILGLFAFGYVASETFWQRIDTLKAATGQSQEVLDTSAQSRIELLKAQWLMSKEYPLGAGHRGTESLSARYLNERFLTAGGARSSHNAFMTVLVEQGIPGAILFLFMVIALVLMLRRSDRAAEAAGKLDAGVLNAAIGGSLMVVFIGGMFADFSKCEVQIWMFALLASLTHFSPRHAKEPVMERGRGGVPGALRGTRQRQ
jgi:O-antigen ligase